MWNRGDLLLGVIVSTASFAAIATVTVTIASSDPCTSSLEARVAKLEAQRPLPAPPPTAALPIPHDLVLDPVPCDEVSCVLDNYEHICCAQFRKPTDGLDRAAIRSGVGEILPFVRLCDHMNVKGRVKVSVKVEPDGTISSVTPMEAPSRELATCVSSAVWQARFAPTLRGGSFSYPFLF